MKAKHPTLPPYITKYNTHFYKNYKTGQLIHRSELSKHCPENKELKHSEIIKKRWDLRQD